MGIRNRSRPLFVGVNLNFEEGKVPVANYCNISILLVRLCFC
jgi:hypothetical protein